jgi:hypothetical protein
VREVIYILGTEGISEISDFPHSLLSSMTPTFVNQSTSQFFGRRFFYVEILRGCIVASLVVIDVEVEEAEAEEEEEEEGGRQSSE